MFSTSREVRRIDSKFMADSYSFDTVKEFVYLGSAVSTKKQKIYVSLEIKSRIILSHRCYYALNRQLSNRDLSRMTKIILYNTLILPVLLYYAAAWSLLSTHAAVLSVFKKKVLRKILGPVGVSGDFHPRYNSELYELLNGIYVLISSGYAVSTMSFA